MSFSISRHARPGLGTTCVVGAVAAALALHAPPRAAAACRAAPAAVRATATAPLVRTASDGEVSRDGRCADAQLPPLAIAAAVLAMLAVPRARQGSVMEL